MLSSGSRATAQAGTPCSMEYWDVGPSPPCAFLLRLAPVSHHLQASHLGWVSPFDGLNPCFSAFPTGWSGWRKHWKLPLLPAPLHGAVAQRGQVQCHHSGHDQVRQHHGPALCQQWGETPWLSSPHQHFPPSHLHCSQYVTVRGTGVTVPAAYCLSHHGVQGVGQHRTAWHGDPLSCWMWVQVHNTTGQTERLGGTSQPPKPSRACKWGCSHSCAPSHTPTSALSVHPGEAGGCRQAAGSETAYFLRSRKPEELKDLAPGTNPPFLLFNKELKTDFIKIEEFLEQTLGPPT